MADDQGVPVTGTVSVTVLPFRQVVWQDVHFYVGQTIDGVPADVAARWVRDGWATVAGAKTRKKPRDTGQPDKSFGRGG